ncbi:hypothetical protein Tco_1195158 [Tanacetum coccineum]
MTFLSITFALRLPQTNNQLRTSSKPRNQATIQDRRVIVQTVHRRQTQGYANNGARNTATNPEQLIFLADNRDTIIPAQAFQEILTPAALQTDDLDAFDYDCDDVPSAKAVLTENLSSYDSDVLSEDIVDRNAKVADFEKHIHSLKLHLNATVESHKTLSTTVECLKKESKQKEDKYIDEVIDLQKKNKALDNVVYKMAPSEPALKKEIHHELPSISLVKDSFHKMKEHVNKFDETITFHAKIIGNRIGSWGVEHIKGDFEKDVKPFAQTLQEYFRMFEHGLNKELKEMKAVFNQMETDVAKCFVDKKYFEIEKKELTLDNDRLLEHIICQDVMNVVMLANDHHDNVLHANNNSLIHDNSALDRLKHENDRLMKLLISQDLVHTAVNSLAAINDYKSMEQSFMDEYEENLKLQTELANKNDMIEKAVYNELSKRCSRLENHVKSSLNNVNHVSKTVCNENVKHFVLNANSELVCVTCYDCMFDAMHDQFVRDYHVDVNASVKSKSVKSKSAKSKIVTPLLWFGGIPTTVPVTKPTIDLPIIHDDSSLIPTETPTISPITSTIPPTTPTTHYASPFIHTDSSDDDTPDTPPSPAHEIPPVEVAPPTGQILPAPFGVRRRRVTIVSPEQPIPYGRLHSVDYSSSDYFTSDDSSRDSPSDSSSEMSSDSSSDTLFDSSSGHLSSDHSSPALPSCMRSSHQLCSSVPSISHSSAAITERPSHSSYTGPSHKRSRSPTTSVPVSSPVPEALSSVRADLLPPRKRIRSSNSVTDLKVSSDESSESSVPRETSLRYDIDVKGSDEPYLEPDIDPGVQAEIDECIAYADALRAGGIDVRVVIETVAREEVKTSARGKVEVRDDRVMHPMVLDDILEPSQEEGAIENSEGSGHRIVATGQQSAVQSERISKLGRDNTRLRGMLDVASQRIGRLEACARKATMTDEAVNELIAHRVAEALEARDATRNLEPLVEGGNEQEDKNGDDYEGGNRGGNKNGNGNRGVNGNRNRGGNDNENGNGNSNENDFLECQQLNFKGAEGVVGLTRWFEKMETVFHISNCPQKYQVKYAACTLLDSALTWWNTHKRTIRIDAAYAMTCT